MLKTDIEKGKKPVIDEKSNINDPQDEQLRIKSNLYGSIIKGFEASALKFSTIQSEVKRITQNKTVRECELVLDKRLDQSEKQELLAQPQAVQELYSQKLTGTAHIKLQNAFKDIEARHNDLLRLERVRLYQLNINYI